MTPTTEVSPTTEFRELSLRTDKNETEVMVLYIFLIICIFIIVVLLIFLYMFCDMNYLMDMITSNKVKQINIAHREDKNVHDE